MARKNAIKILRATRSALETQRAASGLLAGEPYLITNEGRLAFATAVNAYTVLPNITTGPTAPISPVVGDIWIDTSV